MKTGKTTAEQVQEFVEALARFSEALKSGIRGDFERVRRVAMSIAAIRRRKSG